MKLFDRIREILSKPALERGIFIRTKVQYLVGLLRYRCLPIWPGGITYSTYHPDSSSNFSKHPEFTQVLKKWLWGNHTNNAGDIPRLYSLILNLKQIVGEGIPGDFAELGVYKGNSAAVIAHFAADGGKRLFLFDTFDGFDGRDLVGVDSNKAAAFKDTSLNAVKGNVGYANTCVYVSGYFPQSITPQVREATFSFVHIDCDLYGPMIEGLNFFYARLSPGGILFLHDYSSGYWDGAKAAIDEFCNATGETVILLPDKSGSAVVRKRKEKADSPLSSITE